MSNGSGRAVMEPTVPIASHPLPVRWADSRDIVIDPSTLSDDQRLGEACVTCRRRWPRPRVRVATAPDGTALRACLECGPRVVRQIVQDAVQRVLERAAADAERYAPNALCALISSAPQPYGSGPRRVVELAAVLVARHIAETEDLGGGQVLPPVITEWEHAHPWLNAWATTAPPAAVIREVLTAVVAGLPDAVIGWPGGQ